MLMTVFLKLIEIRANFMYSYIVNYMVMLEKNQKFLGNIYIKPNPEEQQNSDDNKSRLNWFQLE